MSAFPALNHPKLLYKYTLPQCVKIIYRNPDYVFTGDIGRTYKYEVDLNLYCEFTNLYSMR